jgi:hypothetical protein
MSKVLIGKTQSLLKTIKKTLPFIKNKQIKKELIYKSLLVINELKLNPEKEENDG